MLLELHIRNYALIEKADLTFEPGLTVITGETGSGKSMVIEALAAAMGARVTAGDCVGRRAESALVEAAFAPNEAALLALSELGIAAEDDCIILSRQIQNTGRSRCRINGQLATVTALERLGRALVDIHGQHEHQSLLSPATHLDLLDAFAGPPVARLLEEFRTLARRYRRLQAEAAGLGQSDEERQKELDLLQYQIEEIKAAALAADEDHQLLEELNLLTNSEELARLLDGAYSAIYEATGDGAGHGMGLGLKPGSASALDQTGQALKYLYEAARYDKSCEELAASLELLAEQLTEAGRAIRLRREQVKADPQRLAEIERRLALIDKLKRKYGSSIAEIQKHLTWAEERLTYLTEAAGLLAERRRELHLIAIQMQQIGTELHELRQAAAEKLDRAVMAQLGDLGMKGAAFCTKLHFALPPAPDGPADEPEQPDDLTFTERGFDTGEFLFSANPGEDVKPLARIASGGEMSRVMLALKVVLTAVDPLPTLIFDEIDAGLGGRMANSVARKLAQLSTGHQVICITHLAQIASKANVHIMIDKEVRGDGSAVILRRLSPAERINEVARMLDGTLSATAVEHARQMLAWTLKGAS
ncbi:MAG TPA: DNA repair protein RecN [Firmicutes bacterium]|nr:DNA repair protein RecN [Bacillota bacterium]